MTQDNNRSIVHIWGAGMDKPLGMPLASELLTEVADFAKGSGAQVAAALRTKTATIAIYF